MQTEPLLLLGRALLLLLLLLHRCHCLPLRMPDVCVYTVQCSVDTMSSVISESEHVRLSTQVELSMSTADHNVLVPVLVFRRQW
jgi:hypothetical protein